MGASGKPGRLMPRAEMTSPLPAHVATSGGAEGLDAILAPSISMAVWERRLDQDLADAVRAALAGGFALLRLTSACEGMAALLPEKLIDAGIDARAATAIAADIEQLGRRFAGIMNRDPIDIRLERVRDNACRKFHADYVTARLITTYHGRATEWLDQDGAARLERGTGPAGLPIRALRQGDVALLKGRLWADDRAIVHRSPPIAGTGEERLLLVINPAAPVPEPLA